MGFANEVETPSCAPCRRSLLPNETHETMVPNGKQFESFASLSDLDSFVSGFVHLQRNMAGGGRFIPSSSLCSRAMYPD